MTSRAGTTVQDALAYLELVNLAGTGRARQVAGVARALAAEPRDPGVSADASVLALAALANAGAWASPAFQAAEERARAALDRFPIPSAVGHLHAVLAIADDMSGGTHAAFGHLLAAARVLREEPEPSVVTFVAWRHLASAQATAGLAEEAMASLEQADTVPTGAAHPGPALGPLLDAALVWDRRGDTELCVRQLDTMLGMVRSGRRRWQNGWNAINTAYAASRLALLGGESGLDPRRLLPSAAAGPAAAKIKRIVLACQALAERSSQAAADFLAAIPADSVVGGGERLRLRSLALTATGRTTEALAAEREGFRLWSERATCLQRVAREQSALVHDELLRARLAASAAEALTDPLTGLPNRRHLDQRLAAVFASPAGAAIGVLDLDRFKQVNTMHGHVVGDRVLRRVADLLALAFRAEDFVARYGGDEFVVLLWCCSRRPRRPRRT